MGVEWLIPGRLPLTSGQLPEGVATRTPYVSSPGPGYASSGDASKIINCSMLSVTEPDGLASNLT
jgi:hypothetical protein